MSGYLEEKKSPEGHICLWQTPNRQRWWGLAAAIIPAAFLIWNLSMANVNTVNVVVGCFGLLIALLITTWTQRFLLNTRYGIYEHTKGFLPFLFGEKGRCQESFECLSLRRETMIDAAKRENDPDADSFEQFRLFLVWKSPTRENIHINTFPGTESESKTRNDFQAIGQKEGESMAKALSLPFVDQTIAYAVVSLAEEILAPVEDKVVEPSP